MDIQLLLVKGLNLAHALKIVDQSGNVQAWLWGALAITGLVILASSLHSKQPTPRIIIVSSSEFNVKEVK